MKLFFIPFLFIFCANTCFAEQNRRINALIFISDHDKAIRKGINKDGSRIENILRKISEKINVELSLTFLSNKKATIGSIKSWAHKIQENDIVVFYYSGHGSQLPHHHKERWPSIVSWKGTWIRGTELINRIQAKSNTSIILFDCCNAFSKGKHKTAAIDRSLTERNINYGVGKRLFCDFRGYIVACGCSLGQRSFCTEDGSFFSITLLDQIINARETDGWFDVLKRTTISCSDSVTPQTPDFELAQSCLED